MSRIKKILIDTKKIQKSQSVSNTNQASLSILELERFVQTNDFID